MAMRVHGFVRICAGAGLMLGLVGCESAPDAGTVDIAKSKAAAAQAGTERPPAMPDGSGTAGKRVPGKPAGRGVSRG